MIQTQAMDAGGTNAFKNSQQQQQQSKMSPMEQ